MKGRRTVLAMVLERQSLAALRARRGTEPSAIASFFFYFFADSFAPLRLRGAFSSAHFLRGPLQNLGIFVG
jgi:hypothetical protein